MRSVKRFGMCLVIAKVLEESFAILGHVVSVAVQERYSE
jgi:hypothetical protein